MKQDNKILIISALDYLKQRDPDWAHVKMLPRLKDLYHTWADKCRRLHRFEHYKTYYSRKWKEGWLPIEEFMDFLAYVME